MTKFCGKVVATQILLMTVLYSRLILVGVLPLAAVLLYLVTLLVKAVRDSKLQSRERYESGESGLSQVETSGLLYDGLISPLMCLEEQT